MSLVVSERVVGIVSAEGWRAVYQEGPPLPLQHFLICQASKTNAVSHVGVIWKDSKFQSAEMLGTLLCYVEPGTSPQMALKRAGLLTENV